MGWRDVSPAYSFAVYYFAMYYPVAQTVKHLSTMRETRV